jgi:O-antigen/teichoic acid export membrane protein
LTLSVLEQRADPDLLATDQAGPAAARGGAMRVAAFLSGSLFVLAAAALLFRHLGVVDTGRFTTATSLGAVVTGLTDLGLTTVAMRELTVLHGEQRDSFARNILGLRLVLTAIGVLLVTAFAFAVYGTLLGLGVLIASCGVFVQNAQVMLAVPLVVQLRLGWVSLLDFVRYLTIALLIVLLVLLGAHLLAFLAVTAIAALLVLPPTIVLIRGDIPLRPSFDTRQWRRLAGPVLAYSAAQAAATLYLRVAIVLVSLISTARQLGYFGASYRLVEALLTLPLLFVGAAFPIFARAAHGDPARLRFALSRVFEIALILGVWISLSLALGARLIIAIIAGPSFTPSVPVLACQGVVVGAVFVSSVFTYGLLSLGLHRVILVFNLGLLLVMTVVVAILASLHGAIGAAIGTAVVDSAAAVAAAVMLMHGRPNLKLDLRIVPKVALAALIGATPALLVGVPVIGRLFLSTLLYAASLLLLRALPPDVLEIFSPRLRRH